MTDTYSPPSIPTVAARSRIEALTQWIKTNAPDIRIDLAITYADLFYQVSQSLRIVNLYFPHAFLS